MSSLAFKILIAASLMTTYTYASSYTIQPGSTIQVGTDTISCESKKLNPNNQTYCRCVFTNDTFADSCNEGHYYTEICHVFSNSTTQCLQLDDRTFNKCVGEPRPQRVCEQYISKHDRCQF